MSLKYRIFPKLKSPYARIDFPIGIPVLNPLPIQMCDDHLLWDLDLDAIDAKTFLAIADLVATAQNISIDNSINSIKAEGKFGICHEHINRVTGDPKIASMSMLEIEATARAYRAKLLLEQSEQQIVLCLSILSAIALYSELGQAVWVLGNNGSKSEAAELVGNWLDLVPPAIAVYAPELAQILIDKQENDADLMLSLLQEIDLELEIKVPIPNYTAYLAIACLQLCSRNPNSRILSEIRHYIRTLSQGILQIAPEVNWLLERGWHPEFDELKFAAV